MMAIENETQEPLAPEMENNEAFPQSFIGARPFSKTIKGTKSANGKKGNLIILLAGGAAVLIIGFLLVSNMPNKGKPRPVPQVKSSANALQHTLRAESGNPSLPNEQTVMGSQPQSASVTSAALQATSRPTDDNQTPDVGGKAESVNTSTNPRKKSSQASDIGGIPDFQPPPTPGSTDQNKQWTPPLYQGGAMAGESVQQIAQLRRAAVVKSSLTVFETISDPHDEGEHTKNSTAESGRNLEEAITNFGYEPGYHLAAHLESVATTAINAPVIAVVDYDYRRNGVTVIPAGSRVIGKLSQSSGSTGIVSITFASIRLNNGMTVPIAAIGLDRQLGPLKGIVTGRNRLKQILIAATGGMGEAAAMFAGNSNVNGQLTEADMMRQQAAQNIGASVDNQVSQMQVTQNIVVTLPAGTPLEVFFTAASKSSTSK